MIRSYLESYLHNLKSNLNEINYEDVKCIIEALIDARNNDKQVFIIGNGGSAAAASHFAVDLGKGTVDNDVIGFRRFRVHCLNDNAAMLTAIGNDLNYDQIFVEQLKNHLNPEDVVIVISASGNSPNILKALQFANSHGARTIGLFGFDGGKACRLTDFDLTVSSCNYGIAEDFHLIINHIITQIIRRILKNEERKVIFLDRDGIINRKADEHKYVLKYSEFEFMPGALSALRYFNEMGYGLVILTNQQCIGKGLLGVEELDSIHAKMRQVMGNNGITIDKIYYCPHRADQNCGCRKPEPGMFYRAQNELSYSIDMSASFMVGDSISDIEAGATYGIRTILVNGQTTSLSSIKPTHQVSHINEIVSILRWEEERGDIREQAAGANIQMKETEDAEIRAASVL